MKTKIDDRRIYATALTIKGNFLKETVEFYRR